MTLGLAVAAGGLLVTAATADPSEVAAASANDEHFAHGQKALDRIGNRLASVAGRNGLTVLELRHLLLTDAALGVDADGGLAYFDALAPGEARAPGTNATPATTSALDAPPTDGAEFRLSSLPGAAKTIYLDFDGHLTSETSWNQAYGIDTIVSPAYDTDGDPATWSTGELRVIRDTWAVVAEDFAPWNVNVTTTDPGSGALSRSAGDSTWGVRVVVTADTFAHCRCGGHAFVGSFDDPADEPVFVYNTSFRGVSEASSHEVGHSMLLAHDGVEGGDVYYQGHGAGDTSWAPIMGAAYYVAVGQWSQQEYYRADNAGPDANFGGGRDDLAIISSLTNGNGFGPRADDHPDGPWDATPIVDTPAVIEGLINDPDDLDAFRFTTGGGPVDLGVAPAAFANVDLGFTLLDGDGNEIARIGEPDRLDASLRLDLAEGTYTVLVDGVGVGDPAGSTPTGYTDYGSIGRYTLTVRLTTTVTDPPTITHATSGTTVVGSVSGQLSSTWSLDGTGQTLTEAETKGRRDRRFDELDHRWQIPSAGGTQTLRVAAEVVDGGDADSGMELAWSTDGTSWVILGVLTGRHDATYSLGAPAGTIQVRVTDTDHRPGERRLDRITVDLLEVSGSAG